MSDLPPIRQKFVLDTTDYKTGAAEINRQLRVIDSGFKAQVAAIGEWGKSAEGLQLRLKALNDTIELQQRKVQATRQEYERLAKEKGENSKAAQDMQIKMNKEVETLGKLQTELKHTETSFNNLQKTSGGLKGALTDLHGNLQQLGQQVPALGTAMNLLTNPITLVGAGLGFLVKQTSDAIREKIAYNDVVQKSMQLTGLEAEEISRIIQVADDWKIDINTVQSALEAMNKKGVSPTIDNLAKIADEYVKAADKSLFMEEATKKYGKSFGDLIPILVNGGQALKDATNAVDDNLVVTEESIKKTRELAIKLDDLQDKFKGLSYTVGDEAIPVLTDFVEILDELIEGIKEGKPGPIWPEIIPQIAQIKLGVEQYKLFVNWLNRGKIATDNLQQSEEKLLSARDSTIISTEKATGATEELTDEQKKANEALYGYEDALNRVRTYQTPVTEGFYAQKAAEDAAKKSTEDLKAVTDDYNTSVNNLVSQAFSRYTESLGQLTVLQAAFDLSTGKITQSQYDQIVQYAPLLENLSTLNQLLLDHKIGMQDYIKIVADGKVTRDELITSLMNAGLSAAEAKLQVDELQGSIDALNGKDITITMFHRDVYESQQNGTYLPDIRQASRQQEGGVHFITRPTLFMGDPGETAIFIPKGKNINQVPGGAGFAGSGAAAQMLGGSQIGPIILQAVPEKEMDFRRLARMVADEIQRRGS